MAGSNKERAMLIMANHVKAANAIYKDTVFGPGNKAEGRCFCCFGLLFILSRNEYLISCASWSSFQMSVKSNCVIAIATLSDWLESLSPVF